MDLHTPKEPPPEPAMLQARYLLKSTAITTADETTALDISPNVKEHLYLVFFEHIQPVFPVVTHTSLQDFPVTPLLESVILGIAARHHLAIASWRDYVHIQKVIAHELKSLFSTRQRYQPRIQTVQALLLALTKFELVTQGHGDIMSIGLRLGLLCKMARDLGLDKTSAVITDGEILNDTLWRACLFQDAIISAMMGQPLNITVSSARLGKVQSDSRVSEGRFFGDAVEASHCLRSLLRTVYASRPIDADIIQNCEQVVQQIHRYGTDLSFEQSHYSKSEYRALCMLHHNNRLLFVLGLAALTNTSSHSKELSLILAQEAASTIPEACQTLTWFSIEFYLDMASRFNQLLYCASRALMLVVDVLLEARRTHNSSKEFIRELENAVSLATSLKNFLLKDTSWGAHWSQGHTLAAVLARLHQTDSPRRHIPVEVKNVMRLQTIDQGDIHNTEAMDVPRDVDDVFYSEEFLNNVLFNSTDWDSVLMQYEESYPQPAW
ncbi:uncharacterized protein A1O5_02987 [Cladophialophora psammophila CBS 110553]|uniref:Xylanolytic transcriptional activator regulatory domain-containing protein n=1 Tax=Cladophialophora psammophila CBS 110553 TaxID=1182543 RepID=W9WYD2_9EURO|nr:uncharacterized protein A1O5_02987 [Cladophialophora psammophila CBS 110553]EXJ73227.1 hypothetical protein A1O5_02987 [Cladophialophora psammophila CBS 110553]